MNRFKKELKKRGIIYEPDEIAEILGYGYNDQQSLIGIYGDFILINNYNDPMGTSLKIYDRNFNLIGGQSLIPDYTSFKPSGINSNPFDVYVR